MTTPPTPAPDAITVADYDPSWPRIYAAERAQIEAVAGARVLALEHIGSTAIPGLCAKPVIDMMAAVAQLSDGAALIEPLAARGYRLIETGMTGRLLLRKDAAEPGVRAHLHIVEQATWDTRNERLLRDYLLEHPEAAQAYGDLKRRLAAAHAEDGLAYTKAKTDLIQSLVDRARAERGLPRVDVWED
jgi:GrpB-like predicted nucleotidyltransferase (UPF0157 family)